MSIKPKYLFLYINDDAVEGLMNQSPFMFDVPVPFRKSKAEARIEYEHYSVECYKIKSSLGDNFRGIRTWQILVENELYNRLSQEDIDYRLKPMLCPYGVLGGRIVSVDIYRK